MTWNHKKRLHLMTEGEATGETSELFSAIKGAVGMPFVPTYYQALGFYEGFLKLHWQSFEPLLRSAAFFRLADRLRAEAYTTLHNYFPIPDLRNAVEEAKFTSGAQRELSSVVAYFYYRDAVILLICAVQSHAFEGNMGDAKAPMKPAQMLPGPPPQPAVAPLLAPEKNVSPVVRSIMEEIRQSLKLPVITNDYLAFARWPDFLREYWGALKPSAASPLYAQYRRGMCESAMDLAGNLLPLPALSMQALEESDIAKDQVASLVHINESFTKAFSANLLNVTFAQIGLEGGNGRKRNGKVEEAA
ncbi:MAG: halocarboxylic acid dehydrogenase DehI family protein [Acidobacteriaceae bacterium]